ncbi:MAG: PDZ domain-containing protein [Candidatus Zixiibacteriota bacterium]|nr:MAG: PDZ domain-containing protein [candidate division Zixibacteria bacterium]
MSLRSKAIVTTGCILMLASLAPAQSFDFNKLYNSASEYTVAVNLIIEVSFGTQTTEGKSRGIGTIVSRDGLVMFDGTAIDSDDPFSLMAGMQVSAEPKSIEISMMDGTKYTAEFIGVDRFTKIGFCRINRDIETTFKYLRFKQRKNFSVGEWLAMYTLLPEYVNPQLAADIGLVSANIAEPESYVLTVGFNELGITSVLYDTAGTAVGVLGKLDNPALTGFDASRMMESFSQIEDYMPLLGLIDAERLNKLIQDPPTLGKVERGWLGVYLQALTPDIAEFWGLESPGGIIINDVAKDSPADSAGVTTGDIIVEVDGVPVEVNKEENIPIFQKQISESGPDATLDFTILRRHETGFDTLGLAITLGRAPLSPGEASEYEDTNFEMKIRDMVFADYSIFNLDRDFKGVVVKEVERGGWSAVGGIFPGDIIQSIGGQQITTVDEAEQALEKVAEEKPEEVVFFVWRDTKTLFINIKTDW